jgi:hypothetical protein
VVERLLLNKRVANTILAVLVPFLAVVWLQTLLSVNLGYWATVLWWATTIVCLVRIWRPRR